MAGNVGWRKALANSVEILKQVWPSELSEVGVKGLDRPLIGFRLPLEGCIFSGQAVFFSQGNPPRGLTAEGSLGQHSQKVKT